MMHYKVSRYIIQISRFELVFNATSAEDARRQARAADTSTLQISSITMADRVGQAILTLTPAFEILETACDAVEDFLNDLFDTHPKDSDSL
jgi:hypothetical protein